MTTERARKLIRAKPWGVSNLHPWSSAEHGRELIGELSYERAVAPSPATSLLLKLLFTGAPLSIQVHPDDAYAKSQGLENGKSEAWYVLDAAPGAKVAIGTNRALTRHELRQAIADGSIEKLVSWHAAKANDVFSVPAGTIHAIGSGLVLAEIQQRSDVTYRLFDHGRERALHPADGAAATHLGVAGPQVIPKLLSKERLLLVANEHFVFERIVLAPGVNWQLEAERETWLAVIHGTAVANSIELAQGDAIFARGKKVQLQAGDAGAECLVSYTGSGGPISVLLERIAAPLGTNRPHFENAPTSLRPIGLSL